MNTTRMEKQKIMIETICRDIGIKYLYVLCFDLGSSIFVN